MQKKKICAVYGEGAVTDRMCQKWFATFPAGDFSLDDAPGLGRQVEVDSGQIETLIEKSTLFTWEIANILKISKSINLLVKMKNVPFIFCKKTYRLLIYIEVRYIDILILIKLFFFHLCFF